MSRFYEALREAGRASEFVSGSDAPTASPEAAQQGATAESGVAAAQGHPQNSANLKPGLAGTAAAPSGMPSDGLNGTNPAPPLSVARNQEPPAKFPPSARVLPNATKGVVLEQYRKLRTKILQQNQIRPFRTLAITSPGPREGKTVTALNLALSFGMLPDYKVLVVDADVRKGSIGTYLGVGDGPGFSNVIEGTARLEDVILQFAEGPIHVLPRGNSSVPAELLFSSQIDGHFRRMGHLYDLVIVDTPPVNLIADSQIIVSKCDAALLVARAFSTMRKDLEKAALELSGTHVIGATLNCGTRAQVYRSYGGYY